MGWFAENLQAHVGDGRPVAVNELARRIGTDRGLVRKWLRGDSVPSVERAALIAEALGVDPRVLLFPPRWPQHAAAAHDLVLDAVEQAARAAAETARTRATRQQAAGGGG